MEELNGLTIVSNRISEGSVLIELSNGSILYIDASADVSWGDPVLEWECKIMEQSYLTDYQKLSLGKITKEEYNEIQAEIGRKNKERREAEKRESELRQLEVLKAKYNLS